MNQTERQASCSVAGGRMGSMEVGRVVGHAAVTYGHVRTSNPRRRRREPPRKRSMDSQVEHQQTSVCKWLREAIAHQAMPKSTATRLVHGHGTDTGGQGTEKTRCPGDDAAATAMATDPRCCWCRRRSSMTGQYHPYVSHMWAAYSNSSLWSWASV